MKIITEYYKTQKTLFRRVNQIRKADGICNFEEEQAGYKLRYCEGIDMENAFVVLKGKDDMPFTLYYGSDECMLPLDKGDLLIYEFEDRDKVWFSTPSMDGSDDAETEEGVGYAVYGTISDMVQAGLIINARYRDVALPSILRAAIKESSAVNSEEPQKQHVPSEQPELIEQEPGIFKLLSRVFENHDLKAALDKVQRISQYCNKQTGNCIRSNHVVYRSYLCSYSYFGGFKYNQSAQMRFGGRWLERMGFEYAQPLKIIGMKDLMLIVPAYPQSLKSYEDES